jgi:tight adherence protein C
VTAAVLLAASAGGIAAVGATDLAQLWSGRRSAARRRLAQQGSGRSRSTARHRVPLRLLLGAGRGLATRAPRDLAARIEVAGLDVPPGDVMAVKTGAALVALLATLPLTPDLPGRLGPALCALIAAGAFLAPDVWLRRRARARRLTVEAELADVLDLLRVAVAAGLSTGRALGEVGRRHPGTLAAELRRMGHALSLGVPLADGLAALERRCPAAGIPPLTAALRRAARHGAPLGATLEAQAAEARSRAARGHTERAARAAPQVQLVVALALVPSVLLLVAAALVPA